MAINFRKLYIATLIEYELGTIIKVADPRIAFQIKCPFSTGAYLPSEHEKFDTKIHLVGPKL